MVDTLSNKSKRHIFDIQVNIVDEKFEDNLKYKPDEILDKPADDVPLPEVRSVVKPYDDDTLPVNTFRAWFLGIAGLADSILVHNSQNYWPAILANIALFESIHSRENPIANGWKITRIKFFLYVFICSFIYYFFPGLISQALSHFTWICWIVPNNVVVNQLFGQVQGLGFNPITFDWTQVSYANGSPLLIPASSQINTIIMILYYKNKMNFAYLPVFSSTVYDNQGNIYNGSRVLNSATMSLDEKAYKKYSPPFLSSTYVITPMYTY